MCYGEIYGVGHSYPLRSRVCHELEKISGSAHPKAGVARLILEDPFLLNSLAKRVLSAVETAGDKVLSLSKHFSEGTRESPGSHGVRRTGSAKSQIQIPSGLKGP